MSDFILKNDSKRYLTQNNYLRNLFGQKVIKLSLNAGFSCPNRDGKKGYGGCTYCSSSLSGDFSGNIHLSITEQMNSQAELLRKKWSEKCYYIAYFQAGSGTYTSVENLKLLFEEALSFPDCVGISVGTRADCIDEDMLYYLSEISKRTYLTIELGLQTIHNKTAERINRCHSLNEFLETYRLLQNHNINTCIHIINGLPDETYEMMMETAEMVSILRPHSLKIHMLHVISGTKLAEEYQNQKFKLMSCDEYIKIVCDQIEIMPDDIIIERVTGDGNKKTLIAPLWTCDKKSVMNGIDKELKNRNSFQGKKQNG